jgi:5-methylcytosine-specific restriction endonuclease McrA
MDYSDYLKTAHWKRIRNLAIENADCHCQVCSSQEKLEVHHNNYLCLWAEQEADLVVLCERCHRLYHEYLPLQEIDTEEPEYKDFWPVIEMSDGTKIRCPEELVRIN